MKSLADARMRLELAASKYPILRKLLEGKLDTPQEIRKMADACSELGIFEVSFLLRSIADGGDEAQAAVAKLALFLSSMAEGELVDELRQKVVGESSELGQLLELFKRIPK
jgi:hypothetical protein